MKASPVNSVGFLSELHSQEVYEAYAERWPTEFTGEAFKEYWEASPVNSVGHLSAYAS